MNRTYNLERNDDEAEPVSVQQQAYFKDHRFDKWNVENAVVLTEVGLKDLMKKVRTAKKEFMGKFVMDKETLEVGFVVNVAIQSVDDGPVLIVENKAAELKWMWVYNAVLYKPLYYGLHKMIDEVIDPND